MSPITTDYQFTEPERRSLVRQLSDLKSNPYSEYRSFLREIQDLQRQHRVTGSLVDIATYMRQKDHYLNPYVRLANCPIDEDVPVFDFDDPVGSKYELKRTFIAEGFLALFAAMTNQHFVRYQLMNNGDAFHDIFAKRSLKDSMSQKSSAGLGHHQDFPIHVARPRWVNMLSMRCPGQNRVYSTFVRNCDVVRSLSDDVLATLAQPIFDTPYDDVTKAGDENRMLSDRDGELRPIKCGTMLNYYEGRTVSSVTEGQAAIASLNAAIADNTVRLQLTAGEFVCFDNDNTLHGRDVASITSVSAHRTRWLIKAHSLPSLTHLENHFVPGRYCVVNG